MAKLVFCIVFWNRQTNMRQFKSAEMSANRRFSDFLGLHEKLVERHQCRGRIIPPPPEKSVIGECHSRTVPPLLEDGFIGYDGKYQGGTLFSLPMIILGYGGTIVPEFSQSLKHYCCLIYRGLKWWLWWSHDYWTIDERCWIYKPIPCYAFLICRSKKRSIPHIGTRI